jgi:hypothetical protein
MALLAVFAPEILDSLSPLSLQALSRAVERKTGEDGDK